MIYLYWFKTLYVCHRHSYSPHSLERILVTADVTVTLRCVLQSPPSASHSHSHSHSHNLSYPRCGSAGALFSFFLFLFYFCVAFTLSLGPTPRGLSEVWNGRGLFVFSWHKVLHKNIMHGSDKKGSPFSWQTGESSAPEEPSSKKGPAKTDKTPQDRHLGHKTPQTHRQIGRQADRQTDPQIDRHKQLEAITDTRVATELTPPPLFPDSSRWLQAAPAL